MIALVASEQSVDAPAASSRPLLILAALSARLDAALGQDPWALGHRSAAFAFAAQLLEGEEVRAFLATADGSQYGDVGTAFLRFLANRRDTRGFTTEW